MKLLHAFAHLIKRWWTRLEKEDPPVPDYIPPRRCSLRHELSTTQPKGVCRRVAGHLGPHVKQGAYGFVDATPPRTIQDHGVVHAVVWVRGNPNYPRRGRPLREVWTACGAFYITTGRHRQKEVTCLGCFSARDKS